MAKSRLEEDGDIYRVQNIIKNQYQSSDGKKYGETHPNALSDGDKKGMGTGVFLDTTEGGNQTDVLGDPSIPNSGRLQNLKVNKYNADNPYTTPDVGDNEGQFTTSVK
jgi:hypothetical protein